MVRSHLGHFKVGFPGRSPVVGSGLRWGSEHRPHRNLNPAEKLQATVHAVYQRQHTVDTCKIQSDHMLSRQLVTRVPIGVGKVWAWSDGRAINKATGTQLQELQHKDQAALPDPASPPAAGSCVM